jgi:hypothetical protein
VTRSVGASTATFYSATGKKDMDLVILYALNEIGAQGWELVASNMEYMHNTASGTPGAGDLEAELVDYYFKRPVTTHTEQSE